MRRSVGAWNSSPLPWAVRPFAAVGDERPGRKLIQRCHYDWNLICSARVGLFVQPNDQGLKRRGLSRTPLYNISATRHFKGGSHGIALDCRCSHSALRRRRILWSPSRLLVRQTFVIRDEGAGAMIRTIMVAAVGLTLLSAHEAWAQTEDQCNQVRAAVAQYGYKAAKAHADATLSHDAVRAASACLKRKRVGTKRHPVARGRNSAR